MKCDVIHDLLPSYLDQTCSEETKRIVDEHLSHCEDCQSLIKELNEVESSVEVQTISESKVFKNIKRNYHRIFMGIIVALIMCYVCAGFPRSSKAVINSMEEYVDRNYPEQNFRFSSMWRDDEKAGPYNFFDATFTSNNVLDAEMHVYTLRGLFSKITDNYHECEENGTILYADIANKYLEDMSKVLEQQDKYRMRAKHIERDHSQGYFDTTMINQLVKNDEYTRSIDQKIPFHIYLGISMTQDELMNYKLVIKEIMKIFDANQFHPKRLTLFIYANEKNYEIRNIDCTKDIDVQKIRIE